MAYDDEVPRQSIIKRAFLSVSYIFLSRRDSCAALQNSPDLSCPKGYGGAKKAPK